MIRLLSLGALCKNVAVMKYKIIFTLVMVIGSPFGVSLLAQEPVPATPVIPAASTEAAKTDPKTAEVVADKAAPTAKAQIEAATKAYDKKSKAFRLKFRAELDRTKRRALYSSQPSATSTVDLILKLAKENPKAEGIEDGLVWSMMRSSSEQGKEAGDLLLPHFKDSEVIGQLASMYSNMWKGGEDGLRQIIAKAGSEEVRQGATYLLASKLIKKDTKSEGLAMMMNLQKSPELAKTNPKLFKNIKRDLFIAENLSVGCTAPDIVGTDHEGKEFKLSDFKGKVVLLDFWGFW